MEATYNRNWVMTDVDYLKKHLDDDLDDLSRVLDKPKSEVKKKRKELMRMVGGTLAVDAKRFEEVFAGMGYTNADICGLMGHHRKYLDVKLRNGIFSKGDVGTIEAVTGVKYDDYRVGWEEIAELAKQEAQKALEELEKKEARKKSRVGVTCHRWTMEEDDLLLECFGKGMSNKDISQLIGRTESAVRQRLATVYKKKQLRKKQEEVTEVPVELPESPVEPLCDNEQADVRKEVEIPLSRLLANGGKFEDILYSVLYRAIRDGIRDALKEEK